MPHPKVIVQVYITAVQYPRSSRGTSSSHVGRGITLGTRDVSSGSGTNKHAQLFSPTGHIPQCRCPRVGRVQRYKSTLALLVSIDPTGERCPPKARPEAFSEITQHVGIHEFLCTGETSALRSPDCVIGVLCCHTGSALVNLRYTSGSRRSVGCGVPSGSQSTSCRAAQSRRAAARGRCRSSGGPGGRRWKVMEGDGR